MAVMLVFVLCGCTKEPFRQAQAPSPPSDPNGTPSTGFTIDTTWLPDTIIPLNP